MSETKNTLSQLWNDGVMIKANGALIGQATSEEYARRIVACVNACEGVHTEVLEDAPGYKAAIDDKMRAIETQVHMLESYREAADAAKRVQVERDQLLAELDCAKNAIVQSINPGSDLIVIKSDGVSKEEAKSIGDWMRRSVTGLSGVIFMPRDSDLSTLSDDELRAAGFVRVRMVLTMENRIAGLIKQRDDLLAALEPLRGKFRSGNCIPVERSVITAKEWPRVESAIAAVEQPGAKPSTDADGWIEWNGGECPVSGNTIVQIKMRDGVKDRDLAKSYSWSNFGIDGDIIAYRIVREGGAV